MHHARRLGGAAIAGSIVAVVVFVVALLGGGGIAGHSVPALSSVQYVSGVTIALARIPALLLATLIGIPLVLYLRSRSRSVFTRVLIACGASAGGALAASAWRNVGGVDRCARIRPDELEHVQSRLVRQDRHRLGSVDSSAARQD